MTTNGLVAGAILSSTAGFVGILFDGVNPDVPWDLLKNAGVTGSILFVGWYFMSRDKEVRKEHATALGARDETFKAVAADFARTASSLTETFSETTTTLMREARSEGAQREAKLAELFQRFTEHKP